jgi:hypothetical protein
MLSADETASNMRAFADALTEEITVFQPEIIHAQHIFALPSRR